MEKLLVRKLNHCLEAALENTQYGFRRGRSTIDAITRLQRTICNTNARGHVVGMLTIDVRNAFNSAPWCKIWHALSGMAVPKYLQDIIRVYLSDRNLFYDINGGTKEFAVEHGVPKCSV